MSERHEHGALVKGWRLMAARTGWLVFVASAIGLFIAGIPARFDKVRTICTDDGCAYAQLWPSELHELEELGFTLDFYVRVVVGGEAVGTVLFAAIGLFVFWRRSDDMVGLLVSMVLLTFVPLLWESSDDALAEAHPSIEPLVVAMSNIAVSAFLLILFIFPNGRFVPRWAGLAPIGVLAYLILSYVNDSSRDNLSLAVVLLLTASLVGGMASQIYRYIRVSNPQERQQTKWAVAGLGGIVVGMIGWLVLSSWFPQDEPNIARVYVSLLAFRGGLLFLMLLFPIALTVAMLRYRLWDIDVILNRALVYAVLTATLAGTYFGCVVLLQAMFRAISGQDSGIAMVISTLVIAALFQPLRRRIQGFIDQRFYRRRYDSARTLAAFTTTAGNEVDLDRLSNEIVTVARDTMQPVQVSLWLKRRTDRI